MNNITKKDFAIELLADIRSTLREAEARLGEAADIKYFDKEYAKIYTAIASIATLDLEP